MSISVITTTASMGGLDMLFYSVACAIARVDVPVEIIIADEWHKERARYPYFDGLQLTNRFGTTHKAINFKHVPVQHKGNYIDHGAGWNSGLRAAEGELICFLNDYFWVYPDYLRDHWEVYKTVPGYSMTGYCDRYAWPKVKERQEPEDVWWTAFEEEFTPERWERFKQENKPIYQERKGNCLGPPVPGTPYRQMPGTLFYASLNESIPMAVLKEINGWDERYDKGYASNDIDLGCRAELAGWKFLLKPTVNCKIGAFGIPRPIKTKVKPQLRPPDENYRMFQRRMEAIRQGEPIAVPEGMGLC
jgi:hypothetical protein